MGERTGIGWTQSTWNPWYGCTKVSPGCAHCYMFRDMERYGRNPDIVQRSKTKFAEPLKWDEPRLVFTCSWSDWFHKDADPWRDEAWDIIRRTPQHTYQILTKRPGRIARHLPWGAYDDPWPNVWLGVSVESAPFLQRVRVLGTIPAAVRFISAEPLLGPLHTLASLVYANKIAWVIAGGESGPEHRTCELDWLREIRNACAASGAAFFLKQLGGWPDARSHDKALLDGKVYTEMPLAPSSSFLR
jgi:protein gp37